MCNRPFAARLGDKHSCPHPKREDGGCVMPECAKTILIGGSPAARRDDVLECEAGDNKIAFGEATVLFSRGHAARNGDPTSHGGEVRSGCTSVLIGRAFAPSDCDPELCKVAWNDASREADEIIDGHDPIERNRIFSSKYAQLYLANNELQFAGMAAFASKQVGCLLVTAKRWAQGAGIMGGPFAGGAARTIFDALAKGNAAVFKEMYPVLTLYSRYKRLGIASCAPECLASVLDFTADEGSVRLATGLRHILDGQPELGARTLAFREQFDILQPQMYDNKMLQAALDLNKQFHITPESVVFSSECGSDIARYVHTLDPALKVYDPNDRWGFATAALEKFAGLTKSDTDYISRQMEIIISRVKR